jgi:hypothetical protein
MSMLRMKSVLTVLVLAVIAGTVPMAFGATTHVVIAGASSFWQTSALGAYRYNGTNGSCPETGAVSPCYHWTGGGSTGGGTGGGQINLRDNRGGINNLDAAALWVVWDSNTSGGQIPDTWIFAKVDSVVGDRCFFANPACQLVDNSSTNADWAAAGAGSISSTLWGADTAIPSSPFTGGSESLLQYFEDPVNVTVNTAATLLRPEDAWWAIDRVNSQLGSSAIGGSNSDGLDGLGYNANYNSGTGPNYTSATTATCTALSPATNAVGTPIYSAYQTTATSSDAANVVSFNIVGKDPITCSTITQPTVYNVGATPVVFINSRYGALASLQNASEQQLQQVFSGTNTDADALGLAEGNISAYLREPLSGTMNVVESNLFRYPTLYSSTTGVGQPVEGLSQETGVSTPSAGSTSNPLNLAAAAGAGSRYRAIGTSEEVKSVLCSFSGTPTGTSSTCKSSKAANTNAADGIGYSTFSYGDFSSLSDSSSYGYITLNGIDPIFLSYNGAGNIDPGQPNPANYAGATAGVLPGAKDVIATPAFPLCEDQIWKAPGLSFPNVRTGLYRSYAVLRLIASSAASAAIKNLVAASNAYVVTSVPDYIPFTKVTLTTTTGTCPATTSGAAFSSDPGFLLVRSHYLERDGAGDLLGTTSTPLNTGTDKGGDQGGAILILEATGFSPSDTQTQLVQSSQPNGNLSPAVRPSN